MGNNRLENTACLYETLAALKKKWMSECRPDQTGLSSTGIKLLRLLVTEGPVRSTKLAARLQVSPPRMTSLANKLVEDRCIKRIENELDRREIILQITDYGQRVLHTAENETNNHMENMVGKLSDLELQQLKDILQKMI